MWWTQVSIPQEAVDLLIQEHSKHPNNQYMFPSPATGEMLTKDIYMAKVAGVASVLCKYPPNSKGTNDKCQAQDTNYNLCIWYH